MPGNRDFLVLIVASKTIIDDASKDKSSELDRFASRHNQLPSNDIGPTQHTIWCLGATNIDLSPKPQEFSSRCLLVCSLLQLLQLSSCYELAEEE